MPLKPIFGNTQNNQNNKNLNSQENSIDNIEDEEKDFTTFKHKCISIIEKLKDDLRKEKNKYSRAFSDFSHTAMEQKN